MSISVEQRLIRGKKIFLVEDHHHVLLPWAELRRRSGQAFTTLTLDHHTDTLPAFTHYAEVHAEPGAFFPADFNKEAEIRQRLSLLRHDEHIDFATRTGIVDQAYLFTHVNFSISTNPAIHIYHEFPGEDPALLEQYYAQALETPFLRHLFDLAAMEFPPAGFVLDIDLDYFKTPRSVAPEDPGVFYELIRRAQAITISRETDWVRLLNMDYDPALTSARIESAVLAHIDAALA
ncbi:MAG: UPF0489 family protein [Lentisphaeria bacterium]|nr:UPF0489 family protein [Lentisphaeria bacterium]